MTLNKKILTSITIALVATLIIPLVLSNDAEAASNRCTGVGSDGVASKCYATKQFIPDTPTANSNIITGFKGKISSTDVNLLNGFNQASYWLKFSNGKFLEVGIKDMAGSRSHLKFVCGVDGGIHSDRFASAPSSTTSYWVQALDTNGDGLYAISANGVLCGNLDSKNNRGVATNVNALNRGTETSFNNMPNFVSDFDKTKLRIDGSLLYIKDSGRASNGSEQSSRTTSGFFVDPCGTGNAAVKHIQTGKGSGNTC